MKKLQLKFRNGRIHCQSQSAATASSYSSHSTTTVFLLGFYFYILLTLQQASLLRAAAIADSSSSREGAVVAVPVVPVALGIVSFVFLYLWFCGVFTADTLSFYFHWYNYLVFQNLNAFLQQQKNKRKKFTDKKV